MEIPYLNLKKMNQQYAEEIKNAINNVFDSGWYVLGSNVKYFEEEFAKYCGVDFCVGVGNGLEALELIFKAYIELGILKEGDEVIVPANTYIASIIGISQNNLVPVLVEPELDTYNISVEKIEKSITNKTKAILAVHLYGQLANMSELKN